MIEASTRDILLAFLSPRLDNWAEWQLAGVGGYGHHRTVAMYGIPGTGGGGDHLLLSAADIEEAVRTQDDIEALPGDEAAAIKARWLSLGTDTTRAAELKCSVSAYQRRLDRGLERLYMKWRG